ncbi:type II toxin-antitoxin system PemK/MazF family toxin [Pseudolysinimonas sp.]
MVWVDLEPTVGPEQNTLRPAVVVSNDSANLSATGRGRGVVTVVPLTRDVARILPIHTRWWSQRAGPFGEGAGMPPCCER